MGWLAPLATSLPGLGPVAPGVGRAPLPPLWSWCLWSGHPKIWPRLELLLWPSSEPLSTVLLLWWRPPACVVHVLQVEAGSEGLRVSNRVRCSVDVQCCQRFGELSQELMEVEILEAFSNRDQRLDDFHQLGWFGPAGGWQVDKSPGHAAVVGTAN